ncbi:MIP/aquaporin family protein [Clostridium algidicarnis]|uniref:Glycerol uptake facilitator protein n=2 Tax=Clostridium algidicarnis TaxID=37659 RepID=A0A2S6FVU7_9CLOT|nr:MIP/aquaporin family protein [Clostridium algidicarnis]MBU3207533.1 aquaporin family protein [Clostridium algidicarnis]MBU3220436.1 aquaporin family protein [Clostridium algidicarnis]PPK46914.1 glycerol uptake facilitator protein [Clostridium algidicarnis DSM 15099]
MSTFMAELLGTMILILLGDGVVANTVLKKSKGENSGWIVIATGWAIAVAIPVYIFGPISGAHFNPAVTIAFASIGKFAWSEVPMYIIAQLIGAFLGAVLVWLAYLPHWEITDDKAGKLAVFSTGPAVRNTKGNLITEIIGTFFLVFALLGMANTKMVDGLAPMVVGLIILAAGLSLGGPTGYAINPARDLGPRIAHAVLPIKGKGDSDWGYAWIPIVGPIIGGLIAAVLFNVMF